MSFDLDQNSWRAFQDGLSMQVASLTSAKGLCDPTGAVKLAPNGPQVRCAMNSGLRFGHNLRALIWDEVTLGEDSSKW